MLIQNEFMFLLGGTEKAFSVCSIVFIFVAIVKLKYPNYKNTHTTKLLLD